MMLSKIKIFLAFMLLSNLSVGCSARPVILRPVRYNDICLMSNCPADEDRVCFSDLYLKEILKVKIDEGVR